MREKGTPRGFRLSDPWGREIYIALEAIMAVEDVGESKLTEAVFFRSMVTFSAGTGQQVRLKVRESAGEVAKAAGLI